MKIKKAYIAPNIKTIKISGTQTILAGSDHHTDDNFSKDNNFFDDDDDNGVPTAKVREL
jgi:hypothetical protein